ncbi:hypothetical protein ACVBEQ_11300 [Nakamurella sp. GG22]
MRVRPSLLTRNGSRMPVTWVLHSYDRAGNRVDEVESPAWHLLMSRAVRAGLQAAA